MVSLTNTSSSRKENEWLQEEAQQTRRESVRIYCLMFFKKFQAITILFLITKMAKVSIIKRGKVVNFAVAELQSQVAVTTSSTLLYVADRRLQCISKDHYS